MNNFITIGIIGLYTLVYLIVFFIQRSQIQKTKEVNESIKSFMEIFKIDEVKKYVDMKQETMMMKFDLLIKNDQKLKDIANESILENANVLKRIYLEQMGTEHMELVKFVLKVLESNPKDERIKIIENLLPNTKRYFLPMISELDKENINE